MLTTRQWKLYNLLKSDPDKWWSQREICDAIAEYTYIDDDRNNCVAIGEDRIIINADDVVDKIIVTKKHCFKIANFIEYKEERARHIRRLQNEIAQVKAQDRKYERNGQTKLFNNIYEELKESNEQTHETFVESSVKTYTRVLVDYKSKVTYLVKAQKLYIEYNPAGCSYYARIILANNEATFVYGISEKTFSLESFNSNAYFNDFERKIIE